eukprot:3661457-Amphidinium_carterae.1
MCGASQTALKRKAEARGSSEVSDAITEAESLHWLGTSMFMLVCLQTLEKGRKGQSAGNSLRLLLAFGSDVERVALTDLDCDTLRLCWHDLDDENCCSHVRAMRADVAALSDDVPHYEKTYQAVSNMFQNRGSCKAITQHLRGLIQLLSESLDGRAREWHASNTVLPELLGPSGKKRRRVDPHVRAKILMNSEHDSRARQWTAADESMRLAAAREFFSKVLHIASAFDGGRIAKPQKDCLVHWLLVPGCTVAYALPPQVPDQISAHCRNSLGSSSTWRVCFYKFGFVS